MNQADGSGLFGSMLAPEPIGIEASPNEAADFNNDGKVDLCVSASSTADVWVLLGAGNGTFSSVTGIPVGGEPHGITTLDADGDGDIDIVSANCGGGFCGSQMPLGGPFLAMSERDAIRTWITNGAVNDCP